MRTRLAALVVVSMAAACAHPKLPTSPASSSSAFGGESSDIRPGVRLAAADALVLTGCLECLLEAYQEYEAIRQYPAFAERASIGAIQSAALVALRQRELGMADDGYLLRARMLAADQSALQTKFAVLLEVIDNTPMRVSRIYGASGIAADQERADTLRRNRARWTDVLRAGADDSPLTAVTWVSFICANGVTVEDRRENARLAPLVNYKDARIVRYESATCAVMDDTIPKVFEGEPRFHESDYWLGFQDISHQKWDPAQEKLTRAFEWHPKWPQAATTLAGLYMTAEEVEAALALYERALSLQPGLGDALIGRVRALSSMGRFTDALARAEELLRVGWAPGEAYFWRAWNKDQLNRVDEAWADIQQAEQTWKSSEVYKLGGLIAYRRKELEQARTRLERAHGMDGEDCDASFYLGAVYADLKAWPSSTEAYKSAVGCLSSMRDKLVLDIATIKASDSPEERKARKITSREQKIALADQMTHQSWFNLAAAYFNLGNMTDARAYAEKLLEDQQFGDRARGLIAQLKAEPDR